MRGVHAALAHLHARGFVHRDVKARNVLFGADGRARLIDFASDVAARRSSARAAARPPRIERRGREGGAVEPFDDAYALAVLIYELLAGRLAVRCRADTPRRRPRGPSLRARIGPAAALAERVLEVLGARDAGLSAFEDVLESAAVAYR